MDVAGGGCRLGGGWEISYWACCGGCGACCCGG